MEALLWLNQNSADPGVDFLKIYQKDEFEYPSSAYGVLSWWDYGHWIMYVAKRIPISSPFQNNVALVAKFFIATNEEDAEKFARNVSAKYIITDYRLTTTTFAAIPLWATGAASQGLYQKTYYQSSPNAPEMYQPVITLRDNFFKAMVTRLQIFDGTQVNPRGTHAITYKNTAINSKTYPIITNIRQISPGETQELILRGLTENTDIVSIQYTSPITKTPALRHYRLVYESPTIIATDDFSKIHNVKIFERVTGHHIPGNGTIEIPLISNQGRKFTYQQDSINGEFIVPYSTIRDGNGTKAAGPYQNLQTGEKFEVTEEQVSRGA
jgi:dolichyl-diphosphooligosaccharide--protein glycosyltransferase